MATVLQASATGALVATIKPTLTSQPLALATMAGPKAAANVLLNTKVAATLMLS